MHKITPCVFSEIISILVQVVTFAGSFHFYFFIYLFLFQECFEVSVFVGRIQLSQMGLEDDPGAVGSSLKLLCVPGLGGCWRLPSPGAAPTPPSASIPFLLVSSPITTELPRGMRPQLREACTEGKSKPHKRLSPSSARFSLFTSGSSSWLEPFFSEQGWVLRCSPSNQPQLQPFPVSSAAKLEKEKRERI